MSDYRRGRKVSRGWYFVLALGGIFVVVGIFVANRPTERQREVSKQLDEFFEEQDRIQRVIEFWGTPIESKGVKLRYSSDIFPKVAAALLEFQTAGIKPDENGEYRSIVVGLSKNGRMYSILYPVKKGMDTDLVVIERFRAHAREYSREVFDDEPVEIVLLDEK